MAPANLALRFVLELAALVGIGALVWHLGEGIVAWIGVIAAPLAAGAAWGTFNVADDPSRSGKAPVAVPGWIRLVLEVAVLVGGAIGIAVAWSCPAGIVLGALVALHYVASYRRVAWLTRQ